MQEMTLDEYEKMMEEKNANLNKAPAKKAAKADMKEFEGMTAYTRKVGTAALFPMHSTKSEWCSQQSGL